jgi:hypothetical protein
VNNRPLGSMERHEGHIEIFEQAGMRCTLLKTTTPVLFAPLRCVLDPLHSSIGLLGQYWRGRIGKDQLVRRRIKSLQSS